MAYTTTDGLKKTFTATATVSQYRVVFLNGGDVQHGADSSGGVSIGATDRAADAGTDVTVVLANGGGTASIEASETITAGDAVYAAADGKVGIAATLTEDVLVGYALESAVDGDVIEVLFA